MNIISASRRTDIPAFYSQWLVNRLRAGFVRYPNPFSGEVYTVSLRPEDVHSIVFWSKHYAPLLPHLDELEEGDYRFYFHYTITGAPRTLEPHVPGWQQAVQVFRKLAERTSSRQVQWRFDPILFTHELGPAFYAARFRDVATALSGATERCYFSFAVFYGKVGRRLRNGCRKPAVWMVTCWPSFSPIAHGFRNSDPRENNVAVSLVGTLGCTTRVLTDASTAMPTKVTRWLCHDPDPTTSKEKCW
jgi:hypothetical protein